MAMRVRRSRLGSIAMPAATRLFAATALLAAADPAFAREAVVTFAPGIEYAVNGVEDIQPVMGVAVNGESRTRHVEAVRLRWRDDEGSVACQTGPGGAQEGRGRSPWPQ